MRNKVKDKIDFLIQFECDNARKPKDDGLAHLLIMSERESIEKIIQIESDDEDHEYGSDEDQAELDLEELEPLQEMEAVGDYKS